MSRGTLKVDIFGRNVRQSRVRWYGHVTRRNGVARKMLAMQLPEKRKWEDQRLCILDVVKDDMHEV